MNVSFSSEMITLLQISWCRFVKREHKLYSDGGDGSDGGGLGGDGVCGICGRVV